MAESPSADAPPLVILGRGTPATLDLQLPQKTAFSIFGRIPGKIDATWFKADCTVAPTPNWWDEIGKLTPVQIDHEIQGVLLGQPSAANLIPSAAVVARPLPRKQSSVLASAPTRQRAAASPTAAARISSAAAPTATAERPPLPGGVPTTDSSSLPKVPADRVQPETVSSAVAAGLRPLAFQHFGGRVEICYLPKPASATPRLYVIEEYRVASYLGRYGAGKTVGTFSLLPGEKTTITVRTYEDRSETSTEAQSILDSFSEDSAEQFENTLQQETGNSQESTTSFGTTASADLGMDVNLLGLVGVKGGGSLEVEADTSTTRQSFANAIANSVESHVASTSNRRDVQVNTSSTQSVSSGEEQSIVRTLENINRSRVLNFVMRQLQQEYLTITYLANIKFLYTNGYPESNEMVDLPELHRLLESKIAPQHVNDAFATLLKPYCSVYNHQDKRFSFIEKVTEDFTNCPFAQPGETFVYWRRPKALHDTYQGIEVPGVILNVATSVLQTPSVIAEALLGQGEALDSYNQDLQAAAVNAAELENERVGLGLETVRAVVDPEKRAAAFAQVFAPPPAPEDEA